MRTLISLLTTIAILSFVATCFWLPEFGIAVAAIILFAYFWAAIYVTGKENSK